MSRILFKKNSEGKPRENPGKIRGKNNYTMAVSPTAKGPGSIPGQGTKIPQDKQWGGKKITRQAKRQKVQFEETEPASEPNTDMAEMLE